MTEGRTSSRAKASRTYVLFTPILYHKTADLSIDKSYKKERLFLRKVYDIMKGTAIIMAPGTSQRHSLYKHEKKEEVYAQI